MAKAHTAAMTCGLVGALALLLGAGASMSADKRCDRASCREQYRRPVEIPFPEDNPYSEAKSKLGRILFFDPILSGSQVRSCATCHNPTLSWTDSQPRAIGEKTLAWRSPTLLNVAWIPKLGWDGHFRDLVQHQRTGGGVLYQTFLVCMRSRKRALGMAEEFRFD